MKKILDNDIIAIYFSSSSNQGTKLMTEEDHPCEVAYKAGIDFFKKYPNATYQQIYNESGKYDDVENFIDGYWSAFHK